MRGSVIRGEGSLERPFQRWGPGRARSGGGGAGAARARDRRGLGAESEGQPCGTLLAPKGVRRPRDELGEGGLGGKLRQEPGPTWGCEPRYQQCPVRGSLSVTSQREWGAGAR